MCVMSSNSVGMLYGGEDGINVAINHFIVVACSSTPDDVRTPHLIVAGGVLWPSW